MPNCGSIVVFGTNGAGKSSFVDATEACIARGKVSHLANEYSGRYQEKALVNTHRPQGTSSSVAVTLADGSQVTARWTKGSVLFDGGSASPLCDWSYRRTALRQEEMAEFIKSTKSEKYSALVPLLGLGHLETAAENLRKAQREIEGVSKVAQLRQEVAAIAHRRQELFPGADDAALTARLAALKKQYLRPDFSAVEPNEVASGILTAVQARIASLDAASREAAALQEIITNKMQGHLGAVRGAAARVAKVTEPLIKERLNVIDAASDFADELATDQQSVACPACGTSVPVTQFRDHLQAEKERLIEATSLFEELKAAVTLLCDEVARLKGVFERRDLANWRAANAARLLLVQDFLKVLDLRARRTSCSEDDLRSFEQNFGALIEVAEATMKTSPDVEALISDKDQITLLRADIAAEGKRSRVKRVDALMTYIGLVEQFVRKEITAQSKRVFGSISSSIQQLWDVLHPHKRITAVRLHVPRNADKAIDVALQFHGVDLESPRLTLSEGQRNALGLCIFLAMAKQDGGQQCPIILDDVVISLDREHRSHVAKLLMEHFADRQLILLTHDREWYFELQRFLPRSKWSFSLLLPFAGPTIGIRIADEAGDFDRARAKIDIDPEDAESNVRRIMDNLLSEVAEQLEVPIPYVRGHANDHRTAGHFAGRIAARAEKSFKIRKDGVYEKNEAAVKALKVIEPQLAVWLNRATHTFSASGTEALAVIDNCERAAKSFVCAACETPVWYKKIEQTGDCECRCGDLHWKS